MRFSLVKRDAEIGGCIGLLHKPEFQIGKGGGGGIWWLLHGLLNATKNCSTVNIQESHDYRLISWNSILVELGRVIATLVMVDDLSIYIVYSIYIWGVIF